MKNKYDFFISHHQDDTGADASLLAELLRNEDYRVFLDVDTYTAGDISQITLHALERSKAFIVLVGKNFLGRVNRENDWVRLEVENAKKLGKDIVPLLVTDIDLKAEYLPESLSFIHSQRSFSYDRSRIYAVVNELIQAFNVRHLARRAPNFSYTVVLVILSLCLGGFLLIYTQVRSDLYHERENQKALKEEIRELKDDNRRVNEEIRELKDDNRRLNNEIISLYKNSSVNEQN